MTIRTRKLIGTFATVVWIALYALVAMAIGGQFVVGSGVLAELAFYAVAGMGWVPVAMIIIKWMSRPVPA